MRTSIKQRVQYLYSSGLAGLGLGTFYTRPGSQDTNQSNAAVEQGQKHQGMSYYTVYIKQSVALALERPKEANWTLPAYWTPPRVPN
jgi:hypothetical protein